MVCYLYKKIAHLPGEECRLMQIQLPWGDDFLSVEVPDTWEIIYPESEKGLGHEQDPDKDELELVSESLKNPLQLQPLSSFDLKGKKIVIVVDDNTRPTPAYRYFHLLLDELEKGGADLKEVVLIPALGIHTPLTEDEMAEKVGAENLQRVYWENHNAFDSNSNSYFGKTRRGTPVYLNKHLAEADLIISIGMVEPHLWAGFGGGLKNLLPGVAATETIGEHHAIIAEPPYKFNRVGMEAEENSFRQDLEEIQDMIEAYIFCINVILNPSQKVIASFAGDAIACHREAVEFNKKVAGKYLEKRVDAIIVNSYPMDINFKQSMKGVGNSLPALKPGGTVIAFLKAERGLDDIVPPEGSKPQWLLKRILRLLGPSRILGFLDRVRKGLNVEERFLMYYSLQLMREYELFCYVPTLTPDEAKKMGYFMHSSDPQENVNKAVKKIPRKARVAVFPEAGATFPIVKEDKGMKD